MRLAEKLDWKGLTKLICTQQRKKPIEVTCKGVKTGYKIPESLIGPVPSKGSEMSAES
jgi:hypothetical protein